MSSPSTASPRLSVVIPFYNEEECVTPVTEELVAVLEGFLPGAWEVLLVNDGSKDTTAEVIEAAAKRFRGVRALHLIPNSGQSAALEAGFRAARGTYVAMLDGDGQNDPHDLPKLLTELERRHVDMMCGIRQKRADNFVRRASSRIANRIRAAILKDGITDVGCSIRVFKRRCLRNIGFFRNAHRYIPALFQLRGFKVAETPVNHRPRIAGESRYGGGINSRLWVGIIDLAGVWWLRKRALKYRVKEDRALSDSGTWASGR